MHFLFVPKRGRLSEIATIGDEYVGKGVAMSDIKRNIFYWVVSFAVSVVVLSGCLTPSNLGDMGQQAGVNHGEIAVRMTGNIWSHPGAIVDVIINGHKRLTLNNNEQGMIIVPNGTYSISAEMRWAGELIMRAENATVHILDNRVLYEVIVDSSEHNVSGSIDMKKILDTAIEGRPTVAVQTGLAAANQRAMEVISQGIDKNNRIAIINISSRDKGQSTFVAGELEHLLVNDGFLVVDRVELDKLRAEQEFQLSFEVDDSTVVDIGKFIGADLVITGSITGERDMRRLRLRVLSTQTARVVATASEPF
jgi:hypothetical protein